MKRSSLPSRSPFKSKGTGLSQTSSLKQERGLESNTPMKLSASLKTGSKMKRKPRVQTSEERRAREIVKTRSGGVCEVCGRREATDMAHRVGAGVGGKWRAGNLLHACRLCHSSNHDDPQNSFDHGWHLRANKDYLQEPVLMAKDGETRWCLLDDEGGIFPTENPSN